ncbi:Bcr/CflA family efflux MFS transporter [Saccharibacter sp. 17.LH.SD]|uniref:multidrug effflux MFS transporter n=1 Tax=Saccharibacter sp. 17.LH.SD TaxID=2689393 RepID=UPI00136A155D|nr:multidrug effflux MFS transporter [Saccharibacter sp. 17.LH.SD]MXV44977.1 Bcr/CflA family efflux MFS transporter [Saccharibacter sp. 17.LH.SD]
MPASGRFSFDRALVGNELIPGRPLPFWLPILLGTLTAVGPVSTDIYLPALPEMERQLGAAPGSGSLTMAAWVAGLAVGQLIVGPLTDRFGRRLPLLIGTLCYAIAAAGCALAPTMFVMCACRAIAAFMAAASLVVPNACVRDLTQGDASAKMMSRLIIIQGVVPILAPALGGFALQFISWRDIFWATSCYGLLGFFVVLLFLPETLSPLHRRDFKLGPVLVRYVHTFKEQHFRYNGLIWMILGFVTFTYLTAAPFLFETVFGLTPFHYGMLFGIFAVCMIGTSQINAFFVGRYRSKTLLKIALCLGFSGSVVLCLLAIWSAIDVLPSGHLKAVYLWPIIGALMLTLGPTGAMGPNAAAGALRYQADNAGSAAALAGTGQYVMGMFASALFSFLPVGTAVPMAIMLLLAMITMLGLSFCVTE